MAKFYFTVGIPGCGKSTYFKNNFGDEVIYISSDKLREELLGDVNDQSKNSLIFNEMYERTITALKENKDVYYDATNLNRKRRINLLKQLPECEKIAIVFAIPFDICCARNNARERVVPQNVMERMYKSFEPPYYVEGFDKIEVVHQDGEKKSIEDILYENMKCVHDNPHHKFSCGVHCLEAAAQASAIVSTSKKMSHTGRYIVCRAARYHDVSKYKCKVFKNRKGEPTEIAHFYNHENVSAYDYLAHTDVHDHEILIANLIANHMVFFSEEKNIIKKKKLYGDAFWNLLEIIHTADLASH